MGCLLLHRTLSAKMLWEGRKESRGDSLKAVHGKNCVYMHSKSGEMRLLFLTFPPRAKPTHALEALP